MLEGVISGGQTGADRGEWRAAKAEGILTGGAMPLGFLAEDGCHPDSAEQFGAHQLDSDDYRAPTEANVRVSDRTLWLGSPYMPGFHCTS
jgi:Circularly permutated YpsA SLOG family